MSRAEREKTRVRKMKQAMRSRIADLSAAEREKRRQESVIAYAARRRAYAEKMKTASPGGNPNEAKS